MKNEPEKRADTMVNKILNDIISGVKARPQDVLRLRHFLVFVFFGIPTMMLYGLYTILMVKRA